MEINQAKRAEEAFEGVEASLASEFMLNLFSKHMCDPFGEFGVYMSLECENKSGRCKTWAGGLGRGLIAEALVCRFGEFALYPVGKSH